MRSALGIAAFAALLIASACARADDVVTEETTVEPDGVVETCGSGDGLNPCRDAQGETWKHADDPDYIKVDSTPPERHAHVRAFSVTHPPLFQLLLTRVYDCYYQDDRVRMQIGVVAGAPFPQGNRVPAGDLSLLDPVIANAPRHSYRRL